MPDRRGKPLRAGDKVIYHGAGGFWYGVLKYDEEERKKYHIITNDAINIFDENGKLVPAGHKEVTRYFDKWPNGIINMDAWAEDILDTGKVDLPEPI